ncbi:MAG TPA: D-2-hydroxyacid dehydrogenase [Hyphomicrobiaceae bacterium]|nr:D-2-hydroxyacid dehydrogenase [Hyphomicrobiaceae bacterium]
MLVPRDQLKICFAHAAYRMAEQFARRNTGIAHFQVTTPDEFKARVVEAHVVVVSMMWRNELAAIAKNLQFIQSISAGLDQYDRDLLRRHNIRLASAAGVNAEAVAQHAMALILALKRQLHSGRDHQSAKLWRGMISDIAAREDQLNGKTLLIVGLGRIGSALARLARAFEMRVIATRRDPSAGAQGADAVYAHDRLPELLPQADVVALTCPLTPQTENLIDAKAIALLRPSAILINVARGRVVDEAALIAALAGQRLAAAGLDVTREEPLPPTSPLWTMPNVLITPHTAGETQVYEDGVIDILLDNLERMWHGETALRNEVI